MLAPQDTLTPGLVIHGGHLVRVDPAIDEIRTVDGEVWQRDRTSAKWYCGPHWRTQDFVVNQILKGAWVRRRPRD